MLIGNVIFGTLVAVLFVFVGVGTYLNWYSKRTMETFLLEERQEKQFEKLLTTIIYNEHHPDGFGQCD